MFSDSDRTRTYWQFSRTVDELMNQENQYKPYNGAALVLLLLLLIVPAGAVLLYKSEIAREHQTSSEIEKQQQEQDELTSKIQVLLVVQQMCKEGTLPPSEPLCRDFHK